MSPSIATTTASRYGVALLLTVIAFLLRQLLLPVLGPTTPFLLLAITASAWYGGLGPGLTATLLGSTLVIGFATFTQSATSPVALPIWPSIFSILLMGVLISKMMDSLHQAHARVVEGTRDLRENHKRFHLMVNSVRDYGIFMLDQTGHIISWNTGASSIKGYEAAEIIGQHFSRFYPPEDIIQGKPEMELRIATETGRFEEEGWRLRKGGSRFWANVVISAVRNEEGELTGFTKVTRDMTERKRAEERTRLLEREQTARIEAEAASQAKDQFLSVLSHELRTPLNSIIGWSSLLRSGKLDAETTKSAFECIERSSKIQTQLVEDLLDVSRMLAGKFQIQPVPIELNSVIQATAEAMQPEIVAKGAHLDIRYYPAPLSVCGDSIRLTQAVSNLISNAIKFTPPEGQISVRLSKIGQMAEIAIIDTGSGIEAAALPHIFERFRQADSSHTRQYGGLGLGLAIVHFVVEAHEGTIEAASEGIGKGATFTVRIPVLATASKE